MARLRARWYTEEAIRAFADDLDDATGDLIAANLILAARRRGPGLATVLEGLAESVADDVRDRRQIEADRAKPRTTARWVTIITVVVLVVLALSGTLRRAVRHPARTGRPVRPALGVRRRAGLDAAHGRMAIRCPGSSRSARGRGRAMSTGLQLAIVAGGLVGVGIALLVARLLPVDPTSPTPWTGSPDPVSQRDGRATRRPATTGSACGR